MSLDVPTAVMQGDSIWLNCTLDLESDDLYSVKWYKDDVEFYRHLPQDSPSGQKYDIPGIRLDQLLGGMAKAMNISRSSLSVSFLSDYESPSIQRN
ncbi:uncharacterized protein TNCV_4211531 [Trichonephila clavipes]|nr:uncharacterized protein TNCV_4211531 [Trichonephila clavipes]